MTMFDEKLGPGTLEIRDHDGKLLGRKAVNLDTFTVRDFAEHLRKGVTLALYRLPLEFDALNVKAKTTPSEPPVEPAKPVEIPIKTGKTHLHQGNIFDELDVEVPSIRVEKPRKPEILEAWGYTIDMGYSRHFKADMRIALAAHLEIDRSNVNDRHKLSQLGLVGPKKVPALFKHFNIHQPIRPNFAKMTFKQFVGLLHYYKPEEE